MFAPDMRIFALTWLCLIGVGVIFFVFDAPYLWRHLSPAVVIIAGVLILFTARMLMIMGTTDPGIIPRGNEHEVREPNGEIPRFKPRTVMGIKENLRYCTTCHVYRPPRASHCRVCDNCVEGFDHHCPWIANCVGSGNYRFFYIYVLSKFLACWYFFALSLTRLLISVGDSDIHDFGEAIKASPSSIVVCIVAGGFGLSVSLLFVAHTFLIAKGLTTHERVSYDLDKSAFDRGVIRNFASTLCGPRAPSRLHLRRPLAQHPLYSALLPHINRDVSAAPYAQSTLPPQPAEPAAYPGPPLPPRNPSKDPLPPAPVAAAAAAAVVTIEAPNTPHAGASAADVVLYSPASNPAPAMPLTSLHATPPQLDPHAQAAVAAAASMNGADGRVTPEPTQDTSDWGELTQILSSPRQIAEDPTFRVSEV